MSLYCQECGSSSLRRAHFRFYDALRLLAVPISGSLPRRAENDGTRALLERACCLMPPRRNAEKRPATRLRDFMRSFRLSERRTDPSICFLPRAGADSRPPDAIGLLSAWRSPAIAAISRFRRIAVIALPADCLSLSTAPRAMARCRRPPNAGPNRCAMPARLTGSRACARLWRWQFRQDCSLQEFRH